MRRKTNNQSGIALMFVLFALLLLTAIAAGLMFMTDTDTSVNANYKASQQAYFAAVAGIEEVRQRLSATGAAAIVPPNQLPSAAGGVLYVLNPAAGDVVQPWNPANRFFDDELCHENFYANPANPGPGIPCTAVPNGGAWYNTTLSNNPHVNTAAAMNYKWVRVTLKRNNSAAPFYVNGSNAAATLDKQACYWNSTETLTPAGYVPPAGSLECTGAYNPVYMLTALAVTPTGSRRMVQMEVSRSSLPPLPGALTLNGPNSNFGPSSPNSNNFVIDGNDTASCGPPEPQKPAIALNGPPNVVNLPRPDHYDGTQPPNPRPPYAPNPASVMDVAAALDGQLKTPQALEDLVTVLTANADQVINGNASAPNLGTSANPLITVVKGNVSMPSSGAGILVVTGTLTAQGNTSFNGIILVIGQGVFDGGGGGNGAYNGAILVAKTRDAAGNILPSLGAANFTWNGGGGNGIRYDSCWTNKVLNKWPYLRLATRELTY